MKNQYFGDVNDYLKYGLIRCLADAGLLVGICWMLTTNDKRSDGSKVRYLSDPLRWRHHDPDLFDILEQVMLSDRRNVFSAESESMIPNARYYSDIVPDNDSARLSWFNRAIDHLAESDLIFFDPDNGVEIPSQPRGRKDSSKYVFWSEVQTVWNHGASLLLFQHFARENRQAHCSRLVARIQKFAPEARIVSLITSNVLFLLVSQSEHEDLVGRAMSQVASLWSGRIRSLELGATGQNQ